MLLANLVLIEPGCILAEPVPTLGYITKLIGCCSKSSKPRLLLEAGGRFLMPNASLYCSVVSSGFMTYAGDAHEDEAQLLTHALSAQHLQREVSEAASRAAEWWQQQTPAVEQAEAEVVTEAASGLDQPQLCRLCLLPTEVVQLPALQLESGKQCLVSSTSVNALYTYPCLA